MARRYLELLDDVKNFIRDGHATAFSTDMCDFAIQPEAVAQLQDILGVLKKLEDICALAETITKPTLVWVCSWIHDIKEFLSTEQATDSVVVNKWKSTLLAEVEKRFGDVFDAGDDHGKPPSLPLRAAIFNHTCGHLPWLDRDGAERVHLQAKKDAEQIRDSHQHKGPFATDPAEAVHSALRALRSMHQDERRRQENVKLFSTADPLDSVPAFCQVLTKPGNFGAPLADLARLYLAGQASSSASEQLWSSASYVRDHRHLLRPENLEALILLRWWTTRAGFSLKSLVDNFVDEFQ